ncbi:hypothetical protein AB0I84_32625, partial [Streptomyces spectabilis]|uniref:hypothetical protein n=1 Tax=Streptomyces spectabilis TaxID=68270 RepID=UPI00340CF8D9
MASRRPDVPYHLVETPRGIRRQADRAARHPAAWPLRRGDPVRGHRAARGAPRRAGRSCRVAGMPDAFTT